MYGTALIHQIPKILFGIYMSFVVAMNKYLRRSFDLPKMGLGPHIDSCVFSTSTFT